VSEVAGSIVSEGLAKATFWVGTPEFITALSRCGAGGDGVDGVSAVRHALDAAVGALGLDLRKLASTAAAAVPPQGADAHAWGSGAVAQPTGLSSSSSSSLSTGPPEWARRGSDGDVRGHADARIEPSVTATAAAPAVAEPGHQHHRSPGEEVNHTPRTATERVVEITIAKDLHKNVIGGGGVSC
jgi:hypothetical protein